MKKLLLINILSITASLFIGSCGGSDGSANTIEDQEYSTNNLLSTIPGIVMTFSLAGQATQNPNDTILSTFSGQITITNRTKEVIDGVEVTPREYLISLTQSDGKIITISEVVYIKNDKTNLKTISEGITCTVNSAKALPSNIKIGDSGNLEKRTCSNGRSVEIFWKAIDTLDNNLLLLVVANGGSIIQSENYIINSNGDILRYYINIHYLSIGQQLELYSY